MNRRPVERVRGTQDLWPRDARPLEAVRRRLEASFESFGYQRMDVPALEQAELHLRKSGLEIIAKLYAFTDQGGRRLCLRPELTASMVRAYVAQPGPRLPQRLYSSGPVFRYERPSKGRFRQFTQSGAELIGAEGPLADAEVIFLAMRALDEAGLGKYRVTIGHVGLLGELLTKLGLTGRRRSFLMESLEAARRHGLERVRAQLQELEPELFDAPEGADGEAAGGEAAADPEAVAARALLQQGDELQARAAIAGLLAQLGAETLGRRSQDEIVERMLRKLRKQSDRDAVERALAFIERLGTLRGAPETALDGGRNLLAEHGLAAEPLQALARTIALLGDFGADLSRVELDLGLSRGLQYYTGMVFEIDHAGIGSESQLCGGGRYDDLVRALGARQATPALGFAFGVERVRLALEAEGAAQTAAPAPGVFVAPAGLAQAGYAARVCQALRAAGLRVQLEVSGRPLRSSLAFANREGFTQVVVVGDAEERQSAVRLRSMADGAERTVPLDAVAAELASPRCAGVDGGVDGGGDGGVDGGVDGGGERA